MWYFIKHELKYYFKNLKEVIYIYSYFISIILLIPFASESQNAGSAQLATLALWLALASGVAIGAQNLFKRDHDAGLLEYYQLLPLSLEWVVAAKWLAFYLFILASLLATLPVAGLLMNLAAEQMLHIALGLGVGAMGLSVLATLSAALLTGLEKAGALLGLILLPLSIPVLIFGAEFCRQGSGASLGNLTLLFGFACFMLPVMCFAGAASIRASN